MALAPLALAPFILAPMAWKGTMYPIPNTLYDLPLALVLSKPKPHDDDDDSVKTKERKLDKCSHGVTCNREI